MEKEQITQFQNECKKEVPYIASKIYEWKKLHSIIKKTSMTQTLLERKRIQNVLEISGGLHTDSGKGEEKDSPLLEKEEEISQLQEERAGRSGAGKVS